jgi:hypothetical protein
MRADKPNGFVGDLGGSASGARRINWAKPSIPDGRGKVYGTDLTAERCSARSVAQARKWCDMSKSFKASMVGLLLSAATAAAFVSPPAAEAVGGNLECDNSIHLIVNCDLHAAGLTSGLTNIQWYWNGVAAGTGYHIRHGCSAPGNEIVTVTYTQAGQNLTESTSPGCNTGPSQ